jgi:hypothetical protein
MGSATLFDDVRPRYIVVLEPDVALVRQIERYKAVRVVSPAA